jgi:hypothetical protein
MTNHDPALIAIMTRAATKWRRETPLTAWREMRVEHDNSMVLAVLSALNTAGYRIEKNDK